MLNTIRPLRYAMKKTQEDVARAIDVRLGTINSIENGMYIPNLLIAMKLCEYFNVKMETLFIMEEKDRQSKKDEDNILREP